VTSGDDAKLGETSGPREPDATGDAARPIPAGVGFTARRTGARDAWVVLALLAAFVLGVRALLTPMTHVLVARIPASFDERVGAAIAEVQRKTGAPIDDARAAHVRALVAEVDPRVRALTDGAALGSLRVTLLASDAVNAFALPGGEVFVLEGLLAKEGATDDVLAGVLAHEIAHASLRHGVKGIVRRNLLRSVAVVLFGGLDSGTVALVGGGLSLGDLAYDRAMEAEADEIAGRALLAMGRPVEPLARFLEELETAGPTVALFQNHPAGRDRAAALRALAAGR
jgi:predicted Zn-dependent protease